MRYPHVVWRHGVAHWSLLCRGWSGVCAIRKPAFAQAPEKLELRYQGWASKVLYPELAEDLGYLAPIKLKWVGNTISGPQDIQAAVTGDVDSAARSTGRS